MKKGQVAISIYVSIFIFLVGIVFINFLIPDVTSFRTSLNCSDAENISDGTKLTCLFGGTVVPYWILLIVSIAGGIIINKLSI